MNPFECDNEVSNNIEPTIVNITIWKEKRGRKTNTYLTGWNLEEDELKGYIKDFKKKKAYWQLRNIMRDFDRNDPAVIERNKRIAKEQA